MVVGLISGFRHHSPNARALHPIHELEAALARDLHLESPALRPWIFTNGLQPLVTLVSRNNLRGTSTSTPRIAVAASMCTRRI